MANHTKPPSKRKVHVLRIMLNRDELRAIATAASHAGMPMSTWTRITALAEAKSIEKKQKRAERAESPQAVPQNEDAQ